MAARGLDLVTFMVCVCVGVWFSVKSHRPGYAWGRGTPPRSPGCPARGALAATQAPELLPVESANVVSVFTPAVRAPESFILTADCIKIPVVIGSGAVFSMRILNQAFCPRPE